jgi:hypothetical protein
MVSVMYGDIARNSSEDEIEDYSASQDDDENQLLTPESGVSPQLPLSVNQNLQSHPDSDHRMNSRMGRHPSHQQLHEAQYSGAENNFYPGKFDVAFHHQQPPSPGMSIHPDGRSRHFPSPRFDSSTNLQWQTHSQILSSPNSNGNGSGQSYYVTSPQSSLPPLTGPYLPPPIQHTSAQQHTQQAMHPPLILPHHQQPQYEPLQGLGGRSYESVQQQHHGLRTGSLGNPHQQHNGFHFEGFLNGDGSVGFGHQDGDLLKNEVDGQGGMGVQSQG